MSLQSVLLNRVLMTLDTWNDLYKRYGGSVQNFRLLSTLEEDIVL